MQHTIDTGQPLDRYIDRFLFAEGWRVTSSVKLETQPGYDVTLTKTIAPSAGQTVRGSATSAGEATFKACSVARRVWSSMTVVTQ
jgi:hypothetical protein